MRRKINKIFANFKKEITDHKIVYVLLGLVLLIGTFIRVYRTDQILGFYYDQGRDALIIWDLWHKGDFFLIGPTTGIAGIFRGPFYFYLISPFYLLGGGSPLIPAYFLVATSMAAVVLLYYLGFKVGGRVTGLFAATISATSFYIMLASRWLSNPTPMLLLSTLLLWMLFVILENPSKGWFAKRVWGVYWPWVVVAFVAGCSLLHFGSAGEVFYFPALAIFALWIIKGQGFGKAKSTLNWKTIIFSIGAFLLTAAPQVLFDVLHDGILRQGIAKFLVQDESFKTSLGLVAKQRFAFYYEVFTSKIFHDRKAFQQLLLGVVGLAFLVQLPSWFTRKKVTGFNKRYALIVVLLLAAPVVGLLFFQGNFGNIYDYYLTGYYLIFVLLFAIVLGRLWTNIFGKVFVLVFFAAFLNMNLRVDRYKIIAGVDGPQTIVLGNQLQAVDWIYQDAADRPFNVDVYVPPVIPYAYDYLFKWRGDAIYHTQPEATQIELLYTLSEVDPDHPQLLTNWQVRQMGIGSIEETTHFGGITVERRKRIKYE